MKSCGRGQEWEDSVWPSPSSPSQPAQPAHQSELLLLRLVCLKSPGERERQVGRPCQWGMSLRMSVSWGVLCEGCWCGK